MSPARRRGRSGTRGTVIRRGAGWAYVVDLGPDPVTGKRRQLWRGGFAAERDAWDALGDANTQLRADTFIRPTSMTVGDFLHRWLDTIKVQVKATTHANYTALAEAYVIPYIGRRKLSEIKPQTVSELYRRLHESGRTKRDTGVIMFDYWTAHRDDEQPVTARQLADRAGVSYSAGNRALARFRAGRAPATGPGLSAKTIASIHIMLRAAFNDAASEAWSLIPTNPAAYASRPRVARRAHQTWKPAELTAFLRTARTERLYPMWLLFATTGIRRSEAAGARIANLDLDDAFLSVATAHVVAAGHVHESDGKTTHSVRTFALDPITTRVLHDHLTALARERADHAATYTDHGLLFCWPDGSQIYPDTITRQFNRLVDRAGLPAIRLHDVRHTYATMALRAGLNPKVLSARLGHASVAFTLQTYTDAVPELDRAGAETVANLFLTDDLDIGLP